MRKRNYIIDVKFLKAKYIDKDLFIWRDSNTNTSNIQYKNFRIQLLLPYTANKELIGIYLDTLIAFQLNKKGWDKYKLFGLGLLGFGFALEYHKPTLEQIESQHKFLIKQIEIDNER